MVTSYSFCFPSPSGHQSSMLSHPIEKAWVLSPIAQANFCAAFATTRSPSSMVHSAVYSPASQQ